MISILLKAGTHHHQHLLSFSVLSPTIVPSVIHLFILDPVSGCFLWSYLDGDLSSSTEWKWKIKWACTFLYNLVFLQRHCENKGSCCHQVLDLPVKKPVLSKLCSVCSPQLPACLTADLHVVQCSCSKLLRKFKFTFDPSILMERRFFMPSKCTQY